MIRKQRLANGLTLLTESMPDVRSVTIGVWLRRGSRHEPARLNGISHFIEHLVFKGTESRTGREIALAMDSIGGQMDAFTSKEYTCFYAKVLDEHLNDAIDLLCDIVRRPLFDATELERERQVVLEEIRMVEDTPDDLVYDLMSSSFYPKHTLGRPIQGTLDTVSGFTRRQLLGFFRRSYRPENMLVAAAGNLRHDRVARRIEKAFGSMKRGKSSKRRATPPRPKPAVVTRSRKELEQLHLLLALPAYPERFSRRYPLYVLNALLGGTMSSRLFQKIREERGLAYSVYSGVQAFLDAGMLVIYVGTSPASGREVVGLVMDELRDLARQGPQQAELDVAKEHIKGSLMLSLESTGSRMSNLARSEIYFGRQRDLGDILESVERVSVRQAHRLARDMIEDQQMGLAAVGRVSRLRFRPWGASPVTPEPEVLFRRLPGGRDLPVPERATARSAGFDLRACVEGEVDLAPGARALVPTGVAIALPEGFEAQVRPRSGLALRHGLTLLNSPGTIDEDYRGEICVIAINLGAEPTRIRRGDRIAQLVVQRVAWTAVREVEELPDTERGAGGFGHTG